MFAYLRYFSAISSLVILAAAIGVGIYFRDLAERDLESLVKRNNTALSQGFVNSTWKNHHDVLMQLSQLDIGEWRKYREFVVFSRDVFRYFEEMPVVRVTLYTRKGEFILSTEPSRINRTGEPSAESAAATGDPALQEASFNIAKAGNISNRVILDATYQAADGNIVKGTLVQTMVPIVSDQYVPVIAGSEALKQENVEGIIEIMSDITPQWRQLYLFQVVGSGGIILIFVVLISLLFITSRRAESIIAKQHEANLELTAAAAAAKAENQNKSQFLANISHELRTPLNAIIGFSEIMKNELMGTFENTQYQDYIRDIHSSGVHLLSLINDILDYSKAEAGKLELEITELDATKVIQNSMRLVSPRAEAAGVRLVESMPKEHFILKTDAKKLKQVMLNLLSNAVKFTPQGGEVRVTAWQNLSEGSISVEVKDSGIGIAPKDISRAMAPFGQVDNALSRKYEGTGLGLPLTRKFVELMGGTFAIQSELNAGTTITFTLPLDGTPKD